MVGPEAFFEVKYLAHAKQMEALDVIPEVAQPFAVDFGRPSGGLVRRYRTEGAETIIVALGSVLGTIESVVDEMREAGVRVGALGIKSFRPFPLEEVREALTGAYRVVVLEKALAVGRGGIVSTDVHEACGTTSAATRWSPGSAGARSPASRCVICSSGPAATSSGRSVSST